MEPNDPKEIKAMLNLLYDTFVKYLNPEVIIQQNSWLEDNQGLFLSTGSSGDKTAERLLTWILENEDATPVINFTNTLRDLSCNDDASLSLVRSDNNDEVQWMKYLVKLLDGNLVNQLSKSDVNTVLDVMLWRKMITKDVHQRAKKIDIPHKSCLKMFKDVTKGKPNWPFVFFEVVNSVRPDLFLPRTQEENQLAEFVSNEVDDFNESSNTCQTSVSLEADKLTEFETNSLDNILGCLDEMSLTDSFFNMRVELMSEETKKVSALPGIQMWLNSGNTAPEYIISIVEQVARLSMCGTSDGENFADERSEMEAKKLDMWDYQIELAEAAALHGTNTIIYAPTGSGKTIVAVYIILKHLLEQHVGETLKRKVVFFARTVPLVMQQFRVLQTFLPKQFKVFSLTGDSKYSLQLELIIPEFDVIVMTPRILENHLIRNKSELLAIFSMMVFDECHHTRKEEPYNTLMIHYLKIKQQIIQTRTRGEQSCVKLPQIVGLTACIGVGNSSTDVEAKDYILQVCGNLDVKHISCVDINIEELRQVVHSSKEVMLKLIEREKDAAVHNIIAKIKELEANLCDLAEKVENAELIGHLHNLPVDRKSIQYGNWIVKVKNAAKSLPRSDSSDKNKWKRLLIILSDYLTTYNVALELHDLVLLRHVMKYLKYCFKQYRENKNCTPDEYSYFQSFLELQEVLADKLDAENPNLTLLKDCLLKYLVEKEENSCGIIFVRTRALASTLTSWLNTCGDERIEGLDARAFTGSSSPAAQGGMTVVQQNEVIQLFKTGQVRILVATSVAEEGIDIPACNLVVKYNYIGNEFSFVQTKGRIRKKGGVSIVLTKDKIIDEKVNQKSVERMERAIQTVRQMNIEELNKIVEVHQIKILKDHERLEKEKLQMKIGLRRQHFKMVCTHCSDVVIDSDDIRTIYQTHHVVINRNILKQTETEPDKKVISFDDIRLIGPVKCMGKVKGGGTCGNKLGSLMIFSNVPFLVLGITRFGFESADYSHLNPFKNWKFVPYIIDEISPQDYERYLPQLSNITTDRDDSFKDKNNTLRLEDYDEKSASKMSKTNERLCLTSGEDVASSTMVMNVGNADQASDNAVKDVNSSCSLPLNMSNETRPLTHTKAFSELDVSKMQTEDFNNILNCAPSLEIKFSNLASPILSNPLPSLQVSIEDSNNSEYN